MHRLTGRKSKPRQAWVAGDTVAVKLDEPGHVLNQAFNGRGFRIQEEIYQIVGP